MDCYGNISDLKMNSTNQQQNEARALGWHFDQIKTEPRVWSWGGGRGGHRRVSPSTGEMDVALIAEKRPDKIEIKFDIRPPRLIKSPSQAMSEKAAIKVLHKTLAGLVMAFLLTSCATSNKIAQGGFGSENHVAALVNFPASTRILVLAPKVQYEDAQTEATIAPIGDSISSLGNAMTEQTIAAFRARGTDKIASADQAGLVGEQQSLALQASTIANRLTKARPDAGTLQIIEKLAAPGEPTAVLAQYLRVKQGPTGTWDPNSGAITSNGSSSQFHAALLDCQTGRTLWQNSVEMRRIPVVGSENFKKTLSALYSTLNPQP